MLSLGHGVKSLLYLTQRFTKRWQKNRPACTLLYLVWKGHLAPLKLICFQMLFWTWNYRQTHLHLHALAGWGVVRSSGFQQDRSVSCVFWDSDQILCRVSCLGNPSVDPKLLVSPCLLCGTETRKISAELIWIQCIWNLPNSLDRKPSGLFQEKKPTQQQIWRCPRLQYYNTLLSLELLIHAFYSTLHKQGSIAFWQGTWDIQRCSTQNCRQGCKQDAILLTTLRPSACL